MRVNPEFESLIPPLTSDEYRRLEKSILKEGVREPIITWNGTIIDGHNRYKICQEHGLDFKTAEREFDNNDAAKIWIIENQFGRRNLGKYERGVLALQLESLYAAEAKKRMSEGGGDKKSGVQKSSHPIQDTGKTRDKLAEIAGISHDTLRKVKIIETEAEKGNETAIEARDAVKSGSKSIHKAYTNVRNNGDKADSRILCSVCGEPIDEGDSYDHDKFKHKACQYKLDNRIQRNKAQLADDGRRICSICGEPIEPGEHYTDKLNWHFKCGLERATKNQRKYRDADRDLRENIAIYTVDSLLTELMASAENLRDSWVQSIEINQSMGVTLRAADKRRIEKASTNLLNVIQKIKDEHND